LVFWGSLSLGACGPSGGDDSDGSVNRRDGSTSKDASGLSDGFVWPDARPTDAMLGCDPRSFQLQQAPPAEVYLVVDRSGSMLEPGATPGLTRWEELTLAVDAALSQYHRVIKFGLLTYPKDNECTTPGPQVGLALDNQIAIMSHLTTAVPAGGTPTAAALNNASSSMLALGDPTSPKYIILATDGGPNCNYFLSASPTCSCTYASPEWCCTSHPASCLFGYTCLDDQRTLDIVEELHQNQSIDTFVIGLDGTDEYTDLLDELALAGGRPQTGGTKYYYPASNQADLLAALQTIAVGLISCQIDLGEAPDFPDLVRIYMDGGEVPMDPASQNGWNYTDASNTTIELFGEPCETLQNGDPHNLTATFACVVN
jgi:hypothetical protein